MATYNTFREPGCTVNHNIKPGSSWMIIDVDFDAIRNSHLTRTFAAGDDLRVAKVKNEWIIGRGYYRVQRASDTSVTYDVSIVQNGATTNLLAAAIDGTATTEWVEMYDTQGQNDGYIWLEVNGATNTKGKLQMMLEIVAHPDDAEPVGIEV